jgi:Fungal specific transcription factor domain
MWQLKYEPQLTGSRWHSSSRSPEADQVPRKLSRPSATTPVSTNSSVRIDKPPVKDYADLKGPSLLKKTLGLQSHRHSRYVGATTEFEPCVLKLAVFDRKEETTFAHNTIRRVADRHMFLMQADDSTPDYQEEIEDLDTIESVVAPHGQELINLYFRIVHPSFPILHKRVYLEKYSRSYREFSPPLLATVYILALNWWSYSSHLSHLPKPDVKILERLALKAIGNVMQRPKISTVQAGLLLLQRPDSDSWSLTSQLIVIGQGLGLHLDCSNWKIPAWEQGLRRRLAWGLYMQDKWSALIYGRPSQIHESNWAVRPVSEQDFPENATDEDEEEGSTEVRKGMILFTQMIELTRILSEILDTFYSLRAMREIENEGRNGTQFILEKVKPLQINLKEWVAGLPDILRMDSTKVMKLSSTGMSISELYQTNAC